MANLNFYLHRHMILVHQYVSRQNHIEKAYWNSVKADDENVMFHPKNKSLLQKLIVQELYYCVRKWEQVISIFISTNWHNHSITNRKFFQLTLPNIFISIFVCDTQTIFAGGKNDLQGRGMAFATHCALANFDKERCMHNGKEYSSGG